jgi:hypothetical protein
MGNALLNILGYVILWYAIQYKRKPNSQINIFTKDWWILFAMIVVAEVIIINTH